MNNCCESYFEWHFIFSIVETDNKIYHVLKKKNNTVFEFKK